MNTGWQTNDGWRQHKGGPIVLELVNKHDPFELKNKTYRVTRCAMCDRDLRLDTHDVTRWFLLPP